MRRNAPPLVDYSPEAISARLAEASRLQRLRRQRRPAVDYAPEAIARRLRAVSQLRALCHRLGRPALR
jgi:hypothetical protein